MTATTASAAGAGGAAGASLASGAGASATSRTFQYSSSSSAAAGGSASNRPGGGGFGQQQSPTSGRDRAMEILLDRDPRGGSYRAARVVEEAVPAALMSRPNLVTKAALIDRVFALAEYAIDSPEKEDAAMAMAAAGGSSPATTSTSAATNANNNNKKQQVQLGAVTKERVLHHQGRIASLKRKQREMLSGEGGGGNDGGGAAEPSSVTEPEAPSPAPSGTDGATDTTTTTSEPKTVTTGGTNSASSSGSSGSIPKAKKTPSPTISGILSPNNPVTATVVTALRQVFDDSGMSSSSNDAGGGVKPAFDLKQLLRKVTSHPVLQQQGGGGFGGSPSLPWQAQLENLLLQIARQEDGGAANNKTFHALFIAILCLVMGHESSPGASTASAFQVIDKAAKLQKQQQPSEPDDDDDAEKEDEDSPVLSLQVASLLALLPTTTTDTTSSSRTITRTGGSTRRGASPSSTDEDDEDNNNTLLLDPETLHYFGQAAAVYEERLEIQKARLLARLPSPRSSSKGGTPTGAATTATVSPGNNKPAALSSASSSSSSSSGSSDSPPPLRNRRDFSDSSDDEEEDHEGPAAAATATSSGPAAATAAPVARTSIQASMTSTATAATVDSSTAGASIQALDNALAAALEDGALAAALDERAAVAAAAQALSAAFEEVLRRSTGEEVVEEEEEDDDDDDDAVSDSEDDDDDDDDDDEDEESDEDSDGVIEEERDTSNVVISTSHSDAELGPSPQQEEQQHESSSEASDREVTAAERADENEDDDEAILRQALSLSLAVAHGDNGTEEESPSAANLHQETEATETTAVVSSAEEEYGKLDDDGLVDVDDSNLPSFPDPPPLNDLGIFVEATPMADLNTTERSPSLPRATTEDSDTQLPLFLDPSALARFGSLPAPHVLIHLLRYATMLMEEQCNASRSNKYTDEFSVVPGGMGSQLFGPAEDLQMSTSAETSKSKDGESEEVSFQLAVATLLLVLEKRDDAIGNLSIAIAREQQADKGDVAAGSELSEVPPSSGEEDDPALTLALNYVEDDVPLSSESLENKGMRRKAAALAHDTAALLRSMRKCTDAWKDKVKLYSYAVLYTMKTIRLLLQCIVRRWLANQQNGSSSLHSDFVGSIPSTSRLSDALMGLMSVSLNSSYLALLGGDEKELGHIFLSLGLYQEAATTWGECLPLLYPAGEDQASLLRSLVDDCSRSKITGIVPQVRSFDSLSALPSSELEPKLHRLQILCRRLRLGDLLDKFIANPLHFSPKTEEDIGKDLSSDINAIEGPHPVSSLLCYLSDALSDIVGARNDLQRLYLALCHRCHTRILLMSGLFGITETELDDPSAAKMSAKSLTAGDTIRVSSSPSKLLFDSTKCSDSIAILNEPSSVHQRASKVWGAVLATKHYNPKSGVHRWAVRLDKCERGHVFVGVATAQASMKTYVGGDKYGWGMIGTQALWHDRRKIRGDYSSTFRTGSTIIVTLDTDAGTLSFGSWKESLDSSQGGGTIEDWGIAFEGLPLDSRLYPAVGLYQRDDRVTLNLVESGSGSCDITGECYFPRMNANDEKAVQQEKSIVRQFNDLLSWEGIKHAVEILHKVPQTLSQNENDAFLITSVLPSLAASLCLIPQAVPTISVRTAITLLPHLERCILVLEKERKEEKVHRLFQTGLKAGKWAIRATGAGTAQEEYMVDFTSTESGFEGTGVGTTGKSKNGLVSIVGGVTGSSVSFVEEWGSNVEGFYSSPSDDASSCVVSARLSLDGNKFEGSYRNVQYGTSGQIAGVKKQHAGSVLSRQSSDLDASLLECVALLSLALSHLATILGEDPAGDLDLEQPETDGSRYPTLREALTSSFLSSASMVSSGSLILKEREFIKEMYSPPFLDLHGIRCGESLDRIGISLKIPGVIELGTDCSNEITSLDSTISAKGKAGSFSCLCPKEYAAARRSIVAVLLHLCGLDQDLSSAKDVAGKVDDQLTSVWHGALQVLEDGVRNALSKSADETKRAVCIRTCFMYCSVSEFLLSLEWFQTTKQALQLSGAVRQLSWFYGLIESDADIEYLKTEMSCSTRRGLMRLLAVDSISTLVTKNIDSTILVECLCAGLPRLLGNDLASSATRSTESDSDEISDSYSNLPGASCHLRAGLLRALHTLSEKLGMILARETSQRNSSTSAESVALIDSLVLTLLALFTVNVYCPDMILDVLPKILSSHRAAILWDFGDSANEGERDSAVKSILSICQRDLSRAVLLTGCSVVHGIMYHGTCSKAHPKTTAECLGVLLGELAVTFPFLEVDAGSELTDSMVNRFEDEIDRWSYSCNPKGKVLVQGKKPKGPAIVGYTGISYLHEHGTALNAVTQVHSQKSPAVNPSKPSFSHHYLSQWLNILSIALRSPPSTLLIAKDQQWQEVLLKVIGLTVESSDGAIQSLCLRGKEKGVLPASFRSRVLRLMLPLFRTMQPSQKLIEGLILLAGSTSNVTTKSLDEEESFVAREAASLVRHLHSPESPWRSCVNQAISSCASCEDSSLDSFWKRMGVLCFFSGDLVSITQGTYVLLKPSAAAALSQDHQTSPSSKGHSSGIGGTPPPVSGATPHHLVGNGSEAIMIGLCRFEASAGIVSSIDMKTAVCEIILLSRNEGLDQNCTNAPKALRSSQNGRHTLTVRALRTPLSDVVLAQEVPLLLDESIPWESLVESMLCSSLNSLLSAAAPGESESTPSSDEPGEDTTVKDTDEEGSALDAKSKHLRSGMLSLSSDLMVLRSCIVVLSEQRILSGFMSKGTGASILSKLLLLAWPEPKGSGGMADIVKRLREKNLSSLPIQEARFCHLRSMLRDVVFRMQLMQQMPDAEWERALAKHQALLKEGTAPDTAATPPVASSRTISSSGGSFIGAPRSEAAARDADSQSNRSISQSTGGSNSEEDEDESEAAAATAAAHLREAAIAQMAELGLPRSWSELALRRTGGTNIEAAVTFCLERGGEMERLLAEERERDRMLQRGTSSSARRRATRDSTTNHLLRQLQDMGFPARWCAEALAVTGNNVDEALTWILTNGERLSEEDEGMEADGDTGDGEDDDEDSADEDEEDEEDDTEQGDASPDQKSSSDTDEPGPQTDSKEGCVLPGEGDSSNAKPKGPSCPSCWTGSIIPLRFISGRASINAETMEVSGVEAGGFSSVGTKGILLTTGKWYYEAILETAGCLQIGWADGSFASHCNSDRGDGAGDGPSSWAYDGWRRYRWHSTATEWGCRWKEGDTVGCLVDMDERIVSFTLNGKGESIGMGTAFSGEGFRPVGGVYMAVSFNRREKLRLILGGKGSEPFKHTPPPGYRGVGEAVLDATEELRALLQKESILDQKSSSTDTKDAKKKFLCDFSDGDHGNELMAWGHRYYGSDASVHLGSGRPKIPSSSSKTSTPTPSFDATSESCLSRRLELEWSKNAKSEPGQCMADVLKAYESVQKTIASDVFNESIVMAVLLARKLLLHVMITMGKGFDLRSLVPNEEEELSWALRFWNVIEASASLSSAGWVGEAGAMAVAAEALGLGISSNEHLMSRSSMERVGVSSATDLDEGLYLPTAGITQLLSTVLLPSPSDGAGAVATGELLAAVSEAAIGSDSGGGLLTFLRDSLQGASCHSSVLRRILVAVIRRSVRLLAVVEYDGDSEPSDAVEDEDDSDRNGPSSRDLSSKNEADESSASALNPDARLIEFLTGLLLTIQTSSSEDASTESELVEAWSVGLLSASLPWRMICGFTLAGILNHKPSLLSAAVLSPKTISRYYGRLPSTIARRIWAERAASPVCSRYIQAMVELLTSIQRAIPFLKEIPQDFAQSWNRNHVDAATPVPLRPLMSEPCKALAAWEADEGWVSGDSGWEIWIGNVQFSGVDWKTPSRSGVRTLMDAGQGPPMLGEGCLVVRGSDWKEGNADGNDVYEVEKAKRDKEKSLEEEQEEKPSSPEETANNVDDSANVDPADPEHSPNPAEPTPDEVGKEEKGKKKKKKKIPSPKLPIGTVLSVEPWNGVPTMARRVRWHLTGEEGVYRYGGDGGRFDLNHVETNEKQTKIKRRHPLPESAEQCAARHGFGARKDVGVILRLAKGTAEEKVAADQIERHCEGILEWPDFGAAVRVSCVLYGDGAVAIEERDLLYGSKDSGWETRFGQPSYCPGSVITLSPTGMSSQSNQAELDAKSSVLSTYEELLGSTTFEVKSLRNKSDGSTLKVTSDMRLFRSRRIEGSTSSSPSPPLPLSFDSSYHATSISLSSDGRTATCIASDGRGTAFASVGFTKGVHYWEVKLEQADIGSVFLGVAEKPSASGSDSPPRLNRWHGYGFCNFRATYTSGAERVYGAHCHAGDTVGVLLDCDAGRVSFFFDGLKYGEHILNDLGCAFENLSPFGFNVDGCGSGGAGQGAPSGFEGGRSARYPTQGAVRPRTLWPVIGLRNQGDRVTISAKWNTSYGIDGSTSLRNILAVDELLNHYSEAPVTESSAQEESLPSWFVRNAFSEYKRWFEGVSTRSITRGSGPYRLSSFGLDLDLDSSPNACAAASAGLGLSYALLAGDRVRLTRSAGRILELAEEAVVLGAYQGRLYYRIVSQKSEGGSLTEGGGRAWCWDESEVVDGLPFVNPGKGINVPLQKLDRFKCLSSGGLRVVYEAGAVLRSDLEIFDGSSNLGNIAVGTVIPQSDVFERRVNSCGVVRYRVTYGDIGEGWISARIRGGKEEMIVEPVNDKESDGAPKASFVTPNDIGNAWYSEWCKATDGSSEEGGDLQGLKIQSLEVFEKLIHQALIPGLSRAKSDSVLAAAVSAVSNFTGGGDAVECPFREVAAALSFALASSGEEKPADISGSSPAADQAVAAVFADLPSPLPPLGALLARIAVVKAFNRLARYALPWLSLRPCQEGSGILGGLSGHGTSTERAGRTRLIGSDEDWVQVPSVASRIRALRGLFFTSIKRGLLTSIAEATTTPTPLSHDEYELPREIRTVRINRLKAVRAMASDDSGAKRKYGVFSQLQNETRNWGGASLRRGHVAKGHGGQKRAFKVKLIGEGVNDYSGPYREAFTDAVNELLQVDPSGRGALGVLDPTPNNASAIGDNRDLFLFSLNGRDESALRGKCTSTAGVSKAELAIRRSFASLMAARDEPLREVEEALVFLGRLAGTAFRHGIPVDLPLAMNSVWKALTEEPAGCSEQLQEVDYLAYRQLSDSKDDFSPLLWWQKRMLNSFAEGLSNVLPVEVLPLLSGEELRDTLCGNPEVDVDLLKRVVEYEGYESTDEVVGFFWETLRELTNEERKKFLQFVWARNRLPMRESDFEAPFKIQKDAINTGERADQALPSASTCFFSLTLPQYTSQEILKSKLLFAIKNVTTMETDFQTNSAEISEGYRTFW